MTTRATNKRLTLAMGIVMAGILAVTLACGAAATATPEPTKAPAATATAAPAATAVATPTRAAALTATAVPVVQPRKGGVLNVAGVTTSFTIRSLDPHFSVQSDEYQLLFVVYNNLVDLGPNLDIQPDLARSWEISADGKAVTFRLAQGVKFHDGTDLNAEAVKWNMDRLMDPKVASSQATLLAGVVSDIQVVDTNTVKFNLVKPNRPFLATMTDRPGMIMSPTAAKKYTPGPTGDFGRFPVGSGPYQLKTWAPDSDIVVEANKSYFETGKPYLDGIKFFSIADPASNLAALRTGQTDMDQLRQVDLPIVANNPNINVVEHQSGAYYGVQLSQVGPFTNKALRQAIAYGVDRKVVCNTYFAGRCREAYTPEGIGWVYNQDIKPYPYDVAKAKAKLIEAGYPNGVDLNIWFAPTNADYGELMQAMLAPLNIRLNIVRVTSQQWFTLRLNKESYFMYASWFPRADPHNRLFILHYGKGGFNTTGYNDPTTDQLLDQAAQEYDLVKAKKLYDEIQTRVTENAHIQYHVYTNVFMGVNKKVNGYKWIPDLFPRLGDVWLSQ